MHRSVRLALPGSLVAAAVLTLGTSTAASAADCGTPGSPAVYDTVSHPASYTSVPAVTHPEWRWTREVPTGELEYSRTVSPGYDLVAWSRSTDVLEYEYETTVIDQPYVPAVPAVPEVGHWDTVVVVPAITITEYEYLHILNERTRWELTPTWNAGPGGAGWVPTGNSRVVEVAPAVTEQRWVVDTAAVPEVPAVPEVSHVEIIWVPEGETAPAGYTATGDSQVADTVVEDVVLPEGEVPDGAGWVEGAVVDVVATVVDLVWVAEGEAAPDGYAATGNARAAGSTTETTDATSAVAPDGDGWTVLDGSEVTVVDIPEHEELVRDAWDEQVLVTPAVPAGPKCVDVNPVTDPQDDDDDDDADVDGPSGGDVPDENAVLPNTGAAVSPWLFGAGLGSLVTGLGLTRAGCRGQRRSATDTRP